MSEIVMDDHTEIHKKVSIDLPSDPAILLSGFYPSEMKSAYEKVSCTFMKSTHLTIN